MNLHDVGVQTLFGLSMRLAAERRYVTAQSGHAATVLEAAGAAVGEAMHRLRGHVQALTRPHAPAGEPVDAMLGALAEELGRGTGFAVSVRVSPAAGRAIAPEAARP